MNKLYSLMRMLWMPLIMFVVMGIFFVMPKVVILLICVGAATFALGFVGNEIAKYQGWFQPRPKNRAPKDFTTPCDFPFPAVQGDRILDENGKVIYTYKNDMWHMGER